MQGQRRGLLGAHGVDPVLPVFLVEPPFAKPPVPASLQDTFSRA